MSAKKLDDPKPPAVGDEARRPARSDPPDLNLLRAFAAVCETNSFTRAAQRLGCPRSTVSRAVTALESAVGAALLRRTTRNVRLTLEGTALFERTAAALHQLDRTFASFPSEVERPAGTVRISVPPDLAAAILVAPCALLVARYPDLVVELRAATHIVDLVGEGFDFGVRVSGSQLRSSGLHAQRLGDVAFHLYATATYLARGGIPRSSADLDGHRWVAFRGPHRIGRRTARSDQGPAPSVVCDDMWLAREMAREHVGLVALPGFLGEPDVEAGRLVRVLPGWLGETATVFLVRPGDHTLPARAVLFRTTLLEHLRAHPLR